MISKRFLIYKGGADTFRQDCEMSLLGRCAYFRSSEFLKDFEVLCYGVRGENPALVCEFRLNPTATAKLSDWEIDSHMQGVLHYIKSLRSDIVPFEVYKTHAFNRQIRAIIRWIKSCRCTYKEGRFNNEKNIFSCDFNAFHAIYVVRS